MKAELLPLSGKYYGTRILITDDKGYQYEIKLWNSGSWEPSDRELESGGISIEQWRSNEIIKVGNDTISAKELVEISDSHFESRETHELANELISLINVNKCN